MTDQLSGNRELGISVMFSTFSTASFTFTLFSRCLIVVIYLFYVHTLYQASLQKHVRYTQQLPLLILFILHLPKNPLGGLILIVESKISGFTCVLVESKYILTCSFQSEIHLNHLESFILCSH